MNCYTIEAVQQAIAQAMWALILGSMMACGLGAFVGRCLYHFIFLFVRRCRRWRRFERAMRKVMA